MKERRVAPILPVELVATILTPPGPAGRSTGRHLRFNRHKSNSDNGLACRLFVVNRLDNRARGRPVAPIMPVVPDLAVMSVVPALPRSYVTTGLLVVT